MRQVKPPANALTLCDKLNAPAVDEPFEQYLGYVIDRYYECVMRHDALVAFNNRV